MVLPHFQRPAFFPAMTYIVDLPPTASFSVQTMKFRQVPRVRISTPSASSVFRSSSIRDPSQVQTGSTVMKKNGFGKLSCWVQGKCKCQPSNLSKFLTALAHIIGNPYTQPRYQVRLSDTGFASMAPAAHAFPLLSIHPP